MLRGPDGVALPSVERKASGNRRAVWLGSQEREDAVVPVVGEMFRSGSRAVSSDSVGVGDGSCDNVSDLTFLGVEGLNPEELPALSFDWEQACEESDDCCWLSGWFCFN